MDVIPVVDEGLGNSAYVVDLGDGGALVVDPERDPRPYLGALDARGLLPRFVVETHLHADFVSGGRELVEMGAQLLAPVGSELSFGHRPLRDGYTLELGGLTLEVIATPGHTPEHLAYLLRDAGRAVALFSGGTLTAGGVARPDLLSAEQTEPLARAAYRSIHPRLLTLPDELAVFPTHGGGSSCSVAGGGERTTTIGRERAANPLLAGDPDEDAFAADTDGRQVLDIRQQAEFAGGHVPGALHVELGTLATTTEGLPATSLLLHCGHGERAMSAASLLERAGHDDVAVLAGGPAELGGLETGAEV